jgi:hypothetical protein
MKYTLSAFAVLLTVLLFTSCTDYGKKATKGTVEVYYKDGISESEATLTANILAYIDSSRNSNNKETRSMQLSGMKDTICFKMVANKDKLAGVDDIAFQVIGTMLADSVFKGKPVTVELTDNTFNTFKKIPYKKLDLNNLPE